jgi:hypothetical protein
MRQAGPGLAAVTSRRGAIAAGGLALAGAASLAAVISREASSVGSVAGVPGLGPAPGNSVMFGATLSVYPGLHAAVPRAVGLRMYFSGENNFPPAWPDPYPGAWITLSLQPNPGDLFSGRLDDQLRAVIDSAPAHSELTFWHENTTGNPLRYPPYVNNGPAAVRMQDYGQRLCRGTRVRFGVITCGPAIQQFDWLAPGLDWYGDDLYEFPRLRGPNDTIRRAKLLHRLNINLEAWRMKSGKRWPAIRLTETNTPFDAHRENWFTWIAQWMAAHNGRRMLTYWNPEAGVDQGGLSGPWPPSPAVVRRLRWLSDEYTGTAAGTASKNVS